MVVWIVVGVVVLALAGWAFSPHRRGVVDRDVLRGERRDQGYVEQFRGRNDIPRGPY